MILPTLVRWAILHDVPMQPLVDALQDCDPLHTLMPDELPRLAISRAWPSELDDRFLRDTVPLFLSLNPLLDDLERDEILTWHVNDPDLLPIITTLFQGA